MGFWIIVAMSAIGIVLILGYALVSPGGDAARSTAEFDVDVYRDQLRELERDVARGTITAEEAERARVEVSRRLLAADKAASEGRAERSAPLGLNIAVFALVAALVAGGGLWLYADLGTPGYADMPLEERKTLADAARETRPSQAEVEAERPEWAGPSDDLPADYVELVEQLRQALARRPDDLQGLTLLAQHEAQLGNFRAAYAAQARLVELLGDEANDVFHVELAEMMILAAGGYVSPEAEASLEDAFRINPTNEAARYYLGLLYAQTGRPDLAFGLWKRLYENSPVDAPWMGPIAAQIGDLAAMAGVNYRPPEREDAPLRGPSAADMEAAADMSPEDRAAMIDGMVNRLMERLAEQGGTAPEWAQLLRALGVQGDLDRAAAIWGEAQTRFAAYPEDLAVIQAAARDAGVEDAAATPREDMGAAPGETEEAGPVTDLTARLRAAVETGTASPADWARLIELLAVQGEDAQAAALWADAEASFAQDAEALEAIRTAARAAGVAQ